MFLRPQHFQQQDFYQESLVADQARMLFAYPWGIRRLEIDRGSLASGVLRVTRIEMIMPDGSLINAPDGDNLPDPVNLAAMPSSEADVTYHLALPLLREFGGNFCPEGEVPRHPARYAQSNRPVTDLFTGAIESDTTTLRKQMRILADHESKDHYVTAPFIRVKRSTTGSYEMAEDFWGPLLCIQASDGLFSLLRRLLDILLAKATALSDHHREASRTIVEFRSGDVASFWLLQTVNLGFSDLKHLYHHPQAHPERLFVALSHLAGSLMTFAKNYRVSDLPIYNHQNPAPGFSALDEIIRELLETVISAKYFAIPLERTKPSYHLGRVESEKLLQGADFYLGVSADMPPAELVGSVPLRFKVGAPDDVERIVLSAMPGVKLMAAPQVPSAIPVRAGTYYFSLESHGPLYERMLQARAISIYTPSGFNELKLELMAVIP